ncbi:MAG: RIP metalloprotease RseP [Spirochaetes bacterium]|nr:RIP metalloprotease RseP [Spirochaetota bacterium]
MIIVTYILAAAILLGLCIFIHELGHLLGGKMVGIKAEIFSIGYGSKAIVKKKYGDTTYQITPIPFGGYCKFYGDDPSEKREGKEYEFLSASPLRRVVVVLMGPLFNLFFGIILFFIMNLVGYSTETNRIIIPDNFKAGEYISPAYSAGMRDGDKIIEINGNEVTSFSEIQSNVLFSEGEKITINAERDNQVKIFNVMPEKLSDKGHYTIGVMPYGEKILLVTILEGDVADEAGFREYDEIKSINGKAVKIPEDFTEIVRNNSGKKLDFSVLRAGNEMTITAVPRTREVLEIEQFENAAFKGEHYNILIDKIDLVKNSIKKGKLQINNITVRSFDHFKRILEENKNNNITLTNSGGKYYGKIRYQEYGFLGVGTAISPEMIHVRHGILNSMSRSVVEPYNFIVMNLKGMGMLFSGKLDVRENLRGPIMIAKIAGDVAYYKGISAFILLMAKISIILMVMNLLPIPVVDGSFILFFLFEAIRGKPINQKVLEKIQFVGIILLIGVGIFVIFNDLSVFPFFQKLFN